MRFLVLLFSCVCFACGGSPNLSPTFSYEGSEEGFVNSQFAALEWNSVCGTGITVTRERGGIPLEEVSDPAWAVEQSGLTTRHGREPKRVQVFAYKGQRQREILAHEMGHAMGLEHRLVVTDVMWAYDDGSERVVNASSCDGL